MKTIKASGPLTIARFLNFYLRDKFPGLRFKVFQRRIPSYGIGWVSVYADNIEVEGEPLKQWLRRLTLYRPIDGVYKTVDEQPHEIVFSGRRFVFPAKRTSVKLYPLKD